MDIASVYVKNMFGCCAFGTAAWSDCRKEKIISL